jgi:hypothetical protein
LSHGASVADSLFELSTDVLGNDLRVELWLSHFGDVDLNAKGAVELSNHSVKNVGQFIDALSASSDDCAWSRREDVDLQAVCSSLDLNPANVSKSDATLNHKSDFVIHLDGGGVALLFVEPVTVVASDDANSKAYWMNFLAH